MCWGWCWGSTQLEAVFDAPVFDPIASLKSALDLAVCSLITTRWAYYHHWGYARMQARVHWLSPFLRKLNGHVKMVSPTISCACTRADTKRFPDSPPSRQVPHPELGVVALDREALQLLLAQDREALERRKREERERGEAEAGRREWNGEERGVFGCYGSAPVAEHQVAAAAAEALLKQGGSLDCFMLVSA